MEWKKTIPKIREREGNDKKALPKFGNGNGMKKSIPFGTGNQRLSFLGMDGNGNFRSALMKTDIHTIKTDAHICAYLIFVTVATDMSV